MSKSSTLPRALEQKLEQTLTSWQVLFGGRWHGRYAANATTNASGFWPWRVLMSACMAYAGASMTGACAPMAGALHMAGAMSGACETAPGPRDA